MGQSKQIIVLITGHFNVLHPGHLRLFKFARECGDRLIVGILSDRLTGYRSLVPESLRLDAVQSNVLVNEAFILDEPIEFLVRRLRPDIVVKGKEHEFEIHPEQNELDSYGGKLIFGSGEIVFSTLDLLRNNNIESHGYGLKVPIKFFERHNINKKKILSHLAKFKDLRVCVIGDLIIDEYVNCQALGMSQEEPAIVVSELDKESFVGGAGIVAAHAAGLGAAVTFLSVAGEDQLLHFAKKNLKRMGVQALLYEDKNRPTTLKKRYRTGGKSLLRVSRLHQSPIPTNLQNDIFKAFISVVNEIDLLVLSDFNYGCLPQLLVDRISEEARKKNIFIAADSQSSSQIGDITRFKGMDLITPTERECRVSLRNNQDGLVILIERIKEEAFAKNVILKLGEDGILVCPDKENRGEWVTDRIEALNSAPKDPAGAGDSLLIATAMSMASGANLWEASVIGSIAAGIQVGRIGNVPINISEFHKELCIESKTKS